MSICVLVCGGRDYADKQNVYLVLNRIRFTHDISTIIEGGASGADALAAEWAREYCVPLWEFPANWDRYGKSAGPICNAQMLNVGEPDRVIAFPGGAGTAHMVRIARNASVQVVEVQP